MEHTTIVDQKFDSNGREIFHKSIKTTNDTTKLVFWSAEYDSNGNKTYIKTRILGGRLNMIQMETKHPMRTIMVGGFVNLILMAT